MHHAKMKVNYKRLFDKIVDQTMKKKIPFYTRQSNLNQKQFCAFSIEH